jgi:hypothetical protein
VLEIDARERGRPPHDLCELRAAPSVEPERGSDQMQDIAVEPARMALHEDPADKVPNRAGGMLVRVSRATNDEAVLLVLRARVELKAMADVARVRKGALGTLHVGGVVGHGRLLAHTLGRDPLQGIGKRTRHDLPSLIATMPPPSDATIASPSRRAARRHLARRASGSSDSFAAAALIVSNTGAGPLFVVRPRVAGAGLRAVAASTGACCGASAGAPSPPW